MAFITSRIITAPKKDEEEVKKKLNFQTPKCEFYKRIS